MFKIKCVVSGIIIFSTFHTILCAAEVDPAKTVVYGPGLNASLVFPARYFFIQAVGKDGKNLTSVPDDTFFVEVVGVNDRCRIWTQVLNRHDGSFLVRYRLYNTCRNLRIRVMHEGTDVTNSPYDSPGPVHNEECFCPDSSFDNWMEQMGCPRTYQQIEDDLKPFSQVNMKNAWEEAKKHFNMPGSYSLCHYAVVKNKVYRECLGEHVGFKMFTDAVLLSLLRKTKLPDVEFLMNLGDWPLIKKATFKTPIPVFSWCKSDDMYDIVLPTYDLTESTLESMGRVSLDMMSVQSKAESHWENKTNKAIWRGRDSRRERLDLVTLSRQRPDLIDAALTNFFFFRDVEAEYGPKVKHMSFFDFFKFKYQINIDGTVAAYRLPYLLAGNSVVLKQDSPYVEHFYRQLTPMVHYIPFQRNLSDLFEKIEWATQHDVEAKSIALNARRFAQENLMPKDILCYNAVLLKKFSKRLVHKVQKGNTMEYVEQAKDEHRTCHCPNLAEDSDKDEL